MTRNFLLFPVFVVLEQHGLLLSALYQFLSIRLGPSELASHSGFENQLLPNLFQFSLPQLGILF